MAGNGTDTWLRQHKYEKGLVKMCTLEHTAICSTRVRFLIRLIKNVNLNLSKKNLDILKHKTLETCILSCLPSRGVAVGSKDEEKESETEGGRAGGRPWMERRARCGYEQPRMKATQLHSLGRSRSMLAARGYLKQAALRNCCPMVFTS